jgi:putative membrane protein
LIPIDSGLYNGFLAAGLFWGLLINRIDIKAFFLCCVIVAGIFGGITVNSAILFIQAFPAILALVLVFASSQIAEK